MNEYLIYTTEGYTEGPNDKVTVENCQVLGRVFAETKKDALIRLQEDSPWIKEAGFNLSESETVQILTEAQHKDIIHLLEMTLNLKEYIPQDSIQDFEGILLKLKAI